jgi:hypothetical protein
MSYRMYVVSDTNPNDTTGGGGCICSPVKQQECVAPYAIFPGNDMENIMSPHVVACMDCLTAASASCRGEILSAGEDGRGAQSQRYVLGDDHQVAAIVDATSADDEGWIPEI